MLHVRRRADGSEVEFEVRSTMLELRGRQYFVNAILDVTERQRRARQAAALAQAAACVTASDSIEAVLDAISECAVAGTRALAAWVKLDAEDPAAGWIGAASVPDGFREHVRLVASTASAASAAAIRLVYEEAMAAQRVAVYADWRQQMGAPLGGPTR